jgi:hypothetical protein
LARPYHKTTHHKKGLVEWLKVKTLSFAARAGEVAQEVEHLPSKCEPEFKSQYCQRKV